MFTVFGLYVFSRKKKYIDNSWVAISILELGIESILIAFKLLSIN